MLHTFGNGIRRELKQPSSPRAKARSRSLRLRLFGLPSRASRDIPVLEVVFSRVVVDHLPPYTVITLNKLAWPARAGSACWTLQAGRDASGNRESHESADPPCPLIVSTCLCRRASASTPNLPTRDRSATTPP